MFELEISESVSVDIFDLKGSLIDKVFSGKLNSGLHRINKNLEKLNTGIYILKINTASGKTQTEKIIKY